MIMLKLGRYLTLFARVMVSDLGQMQSIIEKYIASAFQGQSHVNAGMVFVRVIDSLLDRSIFLACIILCCYDI
jgi:hypothetical protein